MGGVSDYIKTYEDLSRQVGGMVLVNKITSRPLEPINGDLEDEIYHFYIIRANMSSSMRSN